MLRSLLTLAVCAVLAVPATVAASARDVTDGGVVIGSFIDPSGITPIPGVKGRVLCMMVEAAGPTGGSKVRCITANNPQSVGS